MTYLVTWSAGTPLMAVHAFKMLFLGFVVLVTELNALRKPWCACMCAQAQHCGSAQTSMMIVDL